MMTMLDSLRLRQTHTRSRHTRQERRPFARKAVLEFQPGWDQIALEPRTMLSTVVWTNPAGGDWDTGANWSTGSVPGASDDVTINIPAGITVFHGQTDADTVNSLTVTGSGTLSIPSGSLAIESASTIAGPFDLMGGTLGGTGTLTVAGDLDWGDGGTMAGTGQTIATGSVIIAYAVLDTRSFTNEGAALLLGPLAFDNSAVFTNATEAELNASSGAVLSVSDSSSPGFINAGSFNVRPDANDTVTDNGVAFTNTGSVTVSTGTLALDDPGGTDSGSFMVGLHAILVFGEKAVTLSSGSSVSGDGSVVFNNSGTTTVDGAYNLGSGDKVVYATADDPNSSGTGCGWCWGGGGGGFFATYPNLFGTMDLTTGQFTEISATSPLVDSLAASPGGTLYAWGDDTNLYTISPAGATSQDVAITPPGSSYRVLGIASAGAAGFFANSVTPNGDGTFTSILDHMSADGTSISPIGTMGASFDTSNTGDLAFAPNGTLYFDTENASGVPTLYSVNTTNGAATAVGSGLNEPKPLTLVSVGTVLYGIDTYSPTNPAIYTIDTTTGVATYVATVTGLGTGYFLDTMALQTASMPAINTSSLTSVQSNAVVNFGGTVSSLGHELDISAGTVDLGKSSLDLASVDRTGGTLTGTGTLMVTDSLTWTGGSAPKTVSTTLGPGATLSLGLNGAIAGTGYDQLNASGPVNLGGATLNLTGGYAPVKGDVFTIISAPSVTGTFNGLDQGAVVPVFYGQSLLTVNYTPTAVTLTDRGVAVTPTINWPTPNEVVYGTVLSSTQLDATASYNGTDVPGKYTYTYATGPLGFMNAGMGQTLTVSFAPTDSADFMPTVGTTLINILPARLTVDVNSATRSFGQANPTFTVTYFGFLHGDDASVLIGAPKFSTNAAPGSGVGSYPVQAGGQFAQNYTVNYLPGVLNIVPANLTFTAVNKVRSSKAHNPRFTFIESGLVLGQTAKQVFKGAPALSTTAAKHSPIGQYAIVIKQGTLKLLNKNYTFKFVNGVLKVGGKGAK